MTPAQYARNTGEQVAVMESRLDTMAETQSELAQMLRDHMLREEATTKLLLDRISDIELRLSRWYGMVARDWHSRGNWRFQVTTE